LVELEQGFRTIGPLAIRTAAGLHLEQAHVDAQLNLMPPIPPCDFPHL
jgi:hypothetical protein